MKIGDKVRFLNEVGGGVVAGFEGKNVVLVKDEDGFDVPMLRSQVVVVETNENNRIIQRPTPNLARPQQRSSASVAQDGLTFSQPVDSCATRYGGEKAGAQFSSGSEVLPITGERRGGLSPKVRFLEDGVEDDPAARPMSYQPKTTERKGGDLLNVCLAFVPENSRELSNTRFESYLINDSNYFISVVFANNEGTAWHLRWQGIIEPNTKQLLETFDRSVLNDLERLSVQLVAWKQDKPYLMKPAVGVELRLDTVKFYKLHVFQSSPFFREPALVYDIVRDDRPIKQVFVEAEEVLDAMRGVEPAEAPEPKQPIVAVEPEQAAAPAAPEIPQRTRAEEREALKAAKRALKEEIRAQRAKEQAEKALRNPLFAKAMQRPQTENIIEVDLHIDALLDHTEGLSPSVLMNTQLTEFRIIMERNIRKRGQRIVFIHGKGDGTLREALIKELRYRYRSCTYEDAPFQKYGHGATMVTIG